MPVRSRREQAAALCLMRYRDAMGWRREADRALAALETTLAQWIVLEVTETLIRSTEDAVSQNDVAASAGIDRMTVSQVMKNLERARLVDRGPDMYARGYRIWVTDKGKRLVRLGASRLETVSATWLARQSGPRTPSSRRARPRADSRHRAR